MLPAERHRFLASVDRRSTNQVIFLSFPVGLVAAVGVAVADLAGQVRTVAWSPLTSTSVGCAYGNVAAFL